MKLLAIEVHKYKQLMGDFLVTLTGVVSIGIIF